MEQAFIQVAKEVGGNDAPILIFGAFVIAILCAAIVKIWNAYHELVKREVDKD